MKKFCVFSGPKNVGRKENQPNLVKDEYCRVFFLSVFFSGCLLEKNMIFVICAYCGHWHFWEGKLLKSFLNMYPDEKQKQQANWWTDLYIYIYMYIHLEPQ